MQLAAPKESEASPALVIGFVGGFVHSDDLRHAEVQIAQQIQATYDSNRSRALSFLRHCG